MPRYVTLSIKIYLSFLAIFPIITLLVLPFTYVSCAAHQTDFTVSRNPSMLRMNIFGGPRPNWGEVRNKTERVVNLLAGNYQDEVVDGLSDSDKKNMKQIVMIDRQFRGNGGKGLLLFFIRVSEEKMNKIDEQGRFLTNLHLVNYFDNSVMSENEIWENEWWKYLIDENAEENPNDENSNPQLDASTSSQTNSPTTETVMISDEPTIPEILSNSCTFWSSSTNTAYHATFFFDSIQIVFNAKTLSGTSHTLN